MAGKLVRIVMNGNAAAVTIPRPMLHGLGWRPGDLLVPEVLEDRTIRFRPPTLKDIAPERLQGLLALEGGVKG